MNRRPPEGFLCLCLPLAGAGGAGGGVENAHGGQAHPSRGTYGNRKIKTSSGDILKRNRVC